MHIVKSEQQTAFLHSSQLPNTMESDGVNFCMATWNVFQINPAPEIDLSTWVSSFEFPHNSVSFYIFSLQEVTRVDNVNKVCLCAFAQHRSFSGRSTSGSVALFQLELVASKICQFVEKGWRESMHFTPDCLLTSRWNCILARTLVATCSLSLPLRASVHASVKRSHSFSS